MTTHNPPTRSGLNTCEDLHAKLKWEAARLEEDWGPYNAFNFVITAWHLYEDWISAAGSHDMKHKKATLPPEARQVMRAVHDLATGNKHWEMTRPQSLRSQVVTNVSTPVIGDWHSYFIVGPQLYVDFSGYRLSMWGLRHQVMGYFEWVFDDAASPVDFPPQLLKHLGDHHYTQ